MVVSLEQILVQIIAKLKIWELAQFDQVSTKKKWALGTFQQNLLATPVLT